MMTRSKLLVSDAVDNLDCTPEERSDLFEHLRDNDVTGIKDQIHARHYANEMLEMLRIANTEYNEPPKWTQAHHTSQLCKASCCMAPATWQIWVEVVPGIMFQVYACSQHAGKEDECEQNEQEN